MAAAAPDDTELLVLILSNGMAGPELAAVIEGLKSSSKSISSHKRRELYWSAYGAMASSAAGLQNGANCFLLYRCTAEGEGSVEVVELTKRQKGMLSSGSVEVMGRKLKSPEDPTSKAWAMAFSEGDAQLAWDDFMNAEPCVVINSDGIRKYLSPCPGHAALPGPILVFLS